MLKNSLKILGLFLSLSMFNNSFALSAMRDITVHNAIVRAVAPSMKNTAAYMEIENTGRVDHKLVSVSAKICSHAMLHKTVNEKGVFKMQHMGKTNIAANKTLTLAPGGNHIMLMGLKKRLKIGQVVPIVLKFEDGSKIKVDATVKNIT